MIRATATTQDGDILVILGLTDINVDRMKVGEPIEVDLEEMGLKGKLLILHGKDEQSLFSLFQKAGFIGKKTKINIDPKLDITNGKESN